VEVVDTRRTLTFASLNHQSCKDTKEKDDLVFLTSGSVKLRRIFYGIDRDRSNYDKTMLQILSTRKAV